MARRPALSGGLSGKRSLLRLRQMLAFLLFLFCRELTGEPIIRCSIPSFFDQPYVRILELGDNLIYRAQWTQ
jgi:hypothetical protein